MIFAQQDAIKVNQPQQQELFLRKNNIQQQRLPKQHALGTETQSTQASNKLKNAYSMKSETQSGPKTIPETIRNKCRRNVSSVPKGSPE